MRWIVKLADGSGLFRYHDVECEREVEAVSAALAWNPNCWLVRCWPVSDAELAAIKGNDHD